MLDRGCGFRAHRPALSRKQSTKEVSAFFRTRLRTKTETETSSAEASDDSVDEHHISQRRLRPLVPQMTDQKDVNAGSVAPQYGYLHVKCSYHENGTVETMIEPRGSIVELLEPMKIHSMKIPAPSSKVEGHSAQLNGLSRQVKGHFVSKSRKPSSSHIRRKRSVGTETSEVINHLRGKQQMDEFPYFNHDLMGNHSVTEHFHHLVLQSRQSIDKQKADSFLRNVLHAVELAVRHYNGEKSSLADAPRRHKPHSLKSQQEKASKAYERRLVIVVGVVMTVLLMATLLMIVAVVSDRRYGRPARAAAAAAAGGGDDTTPPETGSWLQRNWFFVRICPRRFQGGVGRKDGASKAATRPLPPLPLPNTERGRIDLPPSILQRGGDRGSAFAMELHV